MSDYNYNGGNILFLTINETLYLMFMHNPRYVGVQVHAPSLTRSRFICYTEGGFAVLFLFLALARARARDLSVDFRRVARDNVMRGEKFRFAIAQQKGNIKGRAFLPALVYQAMVS